MGRRRRPQWSRGRRAARSIVLLAGADQGAVCATIEGDLVRPAALENPPIKLSLPPALDLFGEPVPAPRGLGRPRHVPTAELRGRVRQLRAEGLNLLEIAVAIGITHPTLLLNYPAELGSSSQAWRRRAERDGKEKTNG